MRLKNVLIVVKDIDRSKRFYQDLFGLRTITDFGGNVILTEGLVLQDKSTWEQLIEKETIHGDGDMELYFEENQMDDFLKKLEAYPEPVRYLNKPMEHAWGQRVVRFYDPDRHIIEVGENMRAVCRRFLGSGLTPEETAARMDVPVEYVRECAE